MFHFYDCAGGSAVLEPAYATPVTHHLRWLHTQ